MTMFASLSAWADREKPSYSGSFVVAEDGDTVYLYNVGAGKFLSYGNDWGTHATMDERGIPMVAQVMDDSGPTQYMLRNYLPLKNAWYCLFLTVEEGSSTIHCYTDGSTAKSDHLFTIEYAAGSQPQRPWFIIKGAEGNETFKDGGDYAAYLLAFDPDYVNQRDDVTTGTGVVLAETTIDENSMWCWVSKADYVAYELQLQAYEKAQELLALIDEAAELGINTDEAIAAYENTSLTTEQIVEAIAALMAKFTEYYQENVTPSKPIDMTRYITNPDFEDGLTGWTNEAGISTYETGNWNAMIDGESFHGTKYLNLWNPTANQGRVVQTVDGLPNGVYSMTAAAYSNADGGRVFAGSFNTAVVKGDVDESNGRKGQDYTVVALVTDGRLEIGYQSQHEGEFWSCFDNVRLLYFGAGEEAYSEWVEMSLEQAPSMENVRCQNALVEAYNAALKALEEADANEGIMQYISVYINALNEVKANIAAYDALEADIQTAAEQADELYPYYSEALIEYLNVTAASALEEHQLGTDEVNAIREEIASILYEGSHTLDLFNQLIDLNDYLAACINTYTDTSSEEAKTNAQNVYDSVAELLNSDALVNNDILRDYIASVNQAVYDLRIPVVEASDDNPVDYTVYITNPDFEDGLNGWTKDGQLSTCEVGTWGIDGFVLSGNGYLNMWDGTPNARVKQTVTGLPNGTYTLTVSAFSRVASSMYVFAGKDNVLVDATEEISGAARYEVTTVVTDGTLTLGCIVYNADAEVWCVADNFTLTAYGPESVRQPSGDAFAAVAPDAVVSMNEAATVIATEYFDAAGTRLSAPRSGLTIVRQRLSNGQVVTRKMMIR
ncbi:MAG: hypothetical protein J5486_00860 [Bacteroidaceae bacterium]|nr:hypothetical protein [Bacteroidaceae bacterium]